MTGTIFWRPNYISVEVFLLQFLIESSPKLYEVFHFENEDTVARRTLGDLPEVRWQVSDGAEMLPRSVSSRAQALSLHEGLSYNP